MLLKKSTICLRHSVCCPSCRCCWTSCRPFVLLGAEKLAVDRVKPVNSEFRIIVGVSFKDSFYNFTEWHPQEWMKSTNISLQAMLFGIKIRKEHLVASIKEKYIIVQCWVSPGTWWGSLGSCHAWLCSVLVLSRHNIYGVPSVIKTSQSSAGCQFLRVLFSQAWFFYRR